MNSMILNYSATPGQWPNAQIKLLFIKAVFKPVNLNLSASICSPKT